MKNAAYLGIMIVLILFTIALITGCATPVVVKECSETVNGKYYVCKTLGL